MVSSDDPEFFSHRVFCPVAYFATSVTTPEVVRMPTGRESRNTEETRSS
jgi:hypothetical protein